MKYAASTQKVEGRQAIREAKVTCPSFLSRAHPTWDDVAPGLLSPGPSLRTLWELGEDQEELGAESVEETPFRSLPTPYTRVPGRQEPRQLRTDARRGRGVRGGRTQRVAPTASGPSTPRPPRRLAPFSAPLTSAPSARPEASQRDSGSGADSPGAGPGCRA